MTFTFSYETVALIMFASMGLLMLTGQRVFGAIGFCGGRGGGLPLGDGRHGDGLQCQHVPDELVSP